MSEISKSSKMYVVKRNGSHEGISFDKILKRLFMLVPDLSDVEPVLIAQKVVQGIFSGVKTTELDTLAAETAASMATVHPNYNILAARILISNLQKQTPTSFSEAMSKLFNYYDDKRKKNMQLLSPAFFQLVQKHKEELDAMVVPERDYDYDYFGFKTLERSYLMKTGKEIQERPQYMWLRVALEIHQHDLKAVKETYDLLSQKYFTHATPTLFNAGTNYPQMSSCFLLMMKEDSIDGIYETLKRTALISKYAGGIGLAISNIRAVNSFIHGTNGTSNGLTPMLRVFNDTARYVDQGGGKRAGSFAMYLEPWHADIFEFLDLRKNTGKEETRARDLFYALWIPDLFMKRVESDGDWSLFCPHEAPGLMDCWGNDFEELYIKYENTPGLPRRTVKAQKLMIDIVEAQIETGTPYILFKDSCNSKSNQQNLGTIHSSNLCTEIVEYTAPDEVAVCNLASIALPKFVEIKEETVRKFNYEKLFDTTRTITRNLNKIIDLNYYPLPEAERSNKRHRPIGIGVQGLADVFMMMRCTFDSNLAAELNRNIFETIYLAAMTESVQIAKHDGPYETFAGSPLSKGIFQFDMWKEYQKCVAPLKYEKEWQELRSDVQRFGARNSLLVALMPTASTSQILGYNECFEPITSNIYSRRVSSGDFIVVNRYLIEDLIKLNLWNSDMKNRLIAANGSVKDILEIPEELRKLYRTVWEYPQKALVNLAADRSPFIDQSQSLNIFMDNPTVAKLFSLHMHTWKKGLKTGMYYLRTKSARDAIKFTVEEKQTPKTKAEVCTMEEGCTSCSS